MKGSMAGLFVFTLDARRFALRLQAVERVLPSVEVTPLPGAPDIVLGLIEIHGTVLPVVDMRTRFGLPQHEMGLEDRIIIAKTGRRAIGILVDTAGEVIEVDEAAVNREAVAPPADGTIEGVFRTADGIVLIHDLEKLLSVGEERALAEAMAGQGDESGRMPVG
jgi:purine-binding chemotaxis protein CheW